MKLDFINYAITQIGYKETGENYTKYGEWYGVNPGKWCDMFVSYCANKSGISTKIIPKYCNCGDTRKWFEKKALLSANPRVGDLGLVMDGGALHIFIVEYIRGGYVYTIEGNYKDKVKRNKRKIGYNSKTKKGLLFCNVAYNQANYTGTYPKLPSRKYFKVGDKGEEVKKLQKYLNWALSIKLQIDGSYGKLTKNAVIRLEKTLNMAKTNGLYGEKDLAASKLWQN